VLNNKRLLEALAATREPKPRPELPKLTGDPLGWRELSYRSTSENDHYRRVLLNRDARIYAVLDCLNMLPVDTNEHVNIMIRDLHALLSPNDDWRGDDPPKPVKKVMLGIVLEIHPAIKAGSKFVRWFSATQDDERFIFAFCPSTMQYAQIVRVTSQRFLDRLMMATKMVKD
jgi:hypothetical protein